MNVAFSGLKKFGNDVTNGIIALLRRNIVEELLLVK